MRPPPRDPYETTARFAGACQCGDPIHKGDRIFFYPNTRTTTLIGQPCQCGDRAKAEFEAARFDESQF